MSCSTKLKVSAACASILGISSCPAPCRQHHPWGLDSSKSNGKVVASVFKSRCTVRSDTTIPRSLNLAWMVGASTRRGCLGIARNIAHCRINVSFITAPNVLESSDSLCRLWARVPCFGLIGGTKSASDIVCRLPVICCQSWPSQHQTSTMIVPQSPIGCRSVSSCLTDIEHRQARKDRRSLDRKRFDRPD